MRVTPKMISDQMISNLNRNLERLQRVQWQLSTGKKIGKPSDDPVGISMALRYRSELAANEQYQAIWMPPSLGWKMPTPWWDKRCR